MLEDILDQSRRHFWSIWLPIEQNKSLGLCDVIIQNRALSLARYLGLSAIITSTEKMAASSRFATVSEDDFALKCFFSFF